MWVSNYLLYFQDVVLCERLVIHQVMTYYSRRLSWKLRVSYLQYQNDTIHKYFFKDEAVSNGESHSTSTSWALAFQIHGSFIHIVYDSSNLDHQYRSQSAFTSASGLGGSVNLSVLSIIPKVSCLFPFFNKLFKKLLFVEYPSFGDEGIQIIILLGYRLRSWFTSSYCFCMVLPWKRRESNVGRRWYQWKSSHNLLFGVPLLPNSPEQRKTML